MAGQTEPEREFGSYDHAAVEKKWQERWAGDYPTAQDFLKKPKRYLLVEFPYPSGDGLHVGHIRSYTAFDVLTRYSRLTGQNVLFPIGWDAFGLPTENYALKTGVHPREATDRNITNFRRQMKSLGLSFDWSREIDTTDPKYYRWTQWIFLRLYQRGLAYQAEMPINWCPSCRIGLANEEVVAGKCERCGTEVTRRTQKQWMLKITDYAERLLKDLDSVDYPEKIKTQQRNWIGRSEGAEIMFQVISNEAEDTSKKDKFHVTDGFYPQRGQEKEILIATNNPSKVERVRKLLAEVTTDVSVVTPTEAGLSTVDVEEGSDLVENARRKARAYIGKTDLPVLGTDTGLYIDGEQVDPAQVKRNALKGRDEKTLKQEQIGQAIIDYYQEIAKKHGGQVDAYWQDVFVLIKPDGKESVSESRRDITLLTKPHKKIEWHFPLRSFYLVKSTGKYPYDQTEAEELKELRPISDALRELLGGLISYHSEGIRVFTTRPDTIFGATYLVLAPEHELVEKLKVKIENWADVQKYVLQAAKKSDLDRTDLAKDKTGVELKGIRAVNPATNEEIPIWVADYVLMNYGTGAIMAVPAHDERDWEFASKFKLPIKQVIAPYFFHKPGEKDAVQPDKKTVPRKTVYVFVLDKKKNAFLCLDWVKYGWHSGIIGGVGEGESNEEAGRREIREETGYQNLKFIKNLGLEQHNHFFAAHKDENRYAFGQGMLFELKDETKEPVASEHSKNHLAVWIKADKMGEWLNLASFKYMWEVYQSGVDCFTGTGKMIQSGKYNGQDSRISGQAIVKELAATGRGKFAVRYKLRDWVFSRQHYWGEPIPIIHCENCKKTKQKVLLIHGFEGSGGTNWLPWLKQELEKRGFDVFNPTLSNAKHPDLAVWLKELKPLVKDFGPNDIIVGHSLGSKAALHLIEQTKKKVGHLFMIASAIGEMKERDWDVYYKDWPGADVDSLKKFWAASLDLSKISRLVGNVRVVLSDDDKWIKKKTHDNLPASWDFAVWHGFSHFTKEVIPELLEQVLRADNKGIVPVPEKDLPVELPHVEKYQPSGTGESPLAAVKNWVKVKCPVCGKPAKRETDTMPNWAGSSWYYLRYCDPHNDREFAEPAKQRYWLPVDIYNGGMEHTTLHLLYSRFWHKFLYDEGLVPTPEPYQRRHSHGIVLAEDGRKMSKSFGNVINPDDYVKEYGADALRIYELFMGPFEDTIPWSTSGLIGVRRFLDRVNKLVCLIAERRSELKDNQGGSALIHRTVQKVTEDLRRFRFNTAVSTMMEYWNKRDFAPKINEAGDLAEGLVDYEALKKYLVLLYPLAPHLASELWEKLFSGDIQRAWPGYDPKKVKADTFTLVIKINGKNRGKISAPREITKTEAIALAAKEPNVAKHLSGQPKATIYVAGKLVNFVV